MRKLDNSLLDIGYLGYRFVTPIIDPLTSVRNLLSYPKYVKQLLTYSSMKQAEKISLINLFPVLADSTKTSPFDSHYFYQDIWASKKIYSSKTKAHYDIGSNIEYVGFLSTFTKVKFIDIRPIEAQLSNFESIEGDILHLQFKSNSLRSLSCLHVAEHIGLGRYGDPLDTEGTKKACAELSRVLARDGNLYFSLPVGKPRVCFNAHRIHSPKQILEYFPKLKLVEFSGIDDNGLFVQNVKPSSFSKYNYACGLFHFTK